MSVNHLNLEPSLLNVEPSAPSERDIFDALIREGGFDADTAGDDLPRLFAAWQAARSATPKMGMLISGAFGCGKSHFSRAVFPAHYAYNCGVREDVEKLREFRFERLVESDGKTRGLRVILDDAGADVPFSDYGVRVNPVAEFIMAFHDNAEKWVRRGIGEWRLTLTTNLDADALSAHFGGRVVSRLNQLCVPVKMRGGSKRKPPRGTP